MKTKNEKNTRLEFHPGVRAVSGLRAGYECPAGWWKERDGKAKYCCHWAWDSKWGQYYPECTQ